LVEANGYDAGGKGSIKLGEEIYRISKKPGLNVTALTLEKGDLKKGDQKVFDFSPTERLSYDQGAKGKRSLGGGCSFEEPLYHIPQEKRVLGQMMPSC
jgi:hypothetical protein